MQRCLTVCLGLCVALLMFPKPALAQISAFCSSRCQAVITETRELRPPPATEAAFVREYKEALDYYRVRRNFENASRYGTVHAPLEIVKFTASLFPVAGYVVGFGADKLRDAIDEESRETLAKALRRTLSDITRTDPGLAETTRLYNLNAVNVVNTLLGSAANDITDPAERQVLIETAVGELAKQIEAVKTGQRLFVGDLDAMKRDLVRLGNARAGLSKVKGAAAGARAEVSGGPVVGSSNASAEAHSPQAQRAAADQMYQQRMVALEELTKAGVEQFQAAGSVLARVGRPDLADAANKAAGALQLVRAYAALYVNPLGALPALSSALNLLGGPGNNSAQIMHEQVMARLEEIETLIKKNHREILLNLREIKFGLIDVINGVRQTLTSQINQCVGLLKTGSFDELTSIVKRFDLARPSSIAEVRQLSARAGDRLRGCKAGINEVFNSQPEINEALLVRRIASVSDGAIQPVDQKEQVVAFLNQWNGLISGLVQQHFRPEIVRSATEIWPWIPDIEARLQAAPLFMDDTFELRIADVERTIDTLSTLRYAGYTAALHNWFEWVDRQGNVVRLRSGVPFHGSGEGRDALRAAYRIVNAAILQQNLLAGDFIVDFIWSVLSSEDQERYKRFLQDSSPWRTNRDAAIQQAHAILQANPLLARNFAALTIARIGKAQADILGYHTALMSIDDGMLKEFVGTKYPLVKRKAGSSGNMAWHAQVGDALILLPDSRTVVSGRLLAGEYLIDLANLREEIRNELLSYDAPQWTAVSQSALRELARSNSLR